MFCTKCGTQITDGAAFCQKCGARVIAENMNKNQSTSAGNAKKAKRGGNSTVLMVGRVLVGISLLILFLMSF